MFTVEVTPANARTYALHFMQHTSHGYDGYTAEDAASMLGDVMVDFLLGEMTYDVDLAPHCDEWCL